MSRTRVALVAGALLALSGCYHQVVSTGLPAGTTEVKKSFASSWVFGLVPGAPIDVRQQCPNGVAYVSTRFTVPNYFGALVTFGIWYPHEVKVTCASRSAALLPADERRTLVGSATAEEAAAMMRDVMTHVAATGRTVAITVDAVDTTAEGR